MDKTSICNQALVEASIDATITSVDTDSSIEAQRMRRIYDVTKRECLSSANWSFALRSVYLAPVDKPSDSVYSNAFAYPAQAIRIEGVFENEEALKNNDQTFDFVVSANESGNAKLILCDIETPIATILVDVEDEILPQLFVRYFYLNLALKFVKLAGADNDKMARLYQEIQDVRVAAAEFNSVVSNDKLYDEDNYYIDVRG